MKVSETVVGVCRLDMRNGLLVLRRVSVLCLPDLVCRKHGRIER